MTTVTDTPAVSRSVLYAAAIVFVTIIAYLPAINAGYIWDDDSYVTENQLLRDADGLTRIWIPYETPQYYPVVFTTFWVEFQIWELNPAGYHFVNVLLHAANALLLWLVMLRLRVPGAWMIAAVFALHPIHVESVAWITERKNVLSLFFYLLAALAYLRFDRGLFTSVHAAGANRSTQDRPWWWYAIALGMFLLALLSKSVTCSLPAALILVMLWQRTPITAKRLLPLMPMFLIGFVLAMNTAIIEREHVGAVGDDFAFSFIERCMIASQALLFYPWKLLWPSELIFIYPRWDIGAGNIAGYVAIVAVVLIGLGLLELYRRGVRGPFVALSFYAGTIFPAIGFFNVYPHLFSFVADHFVYHASIGVIALVVGGATHVIAKRPKLRLVIAPVLVILFALTYLQSTIYEDAETLWRDTIAKNPHAWMPQNNLGQLLLAKAELHRRAGDEAVMRELALEALGPLEASLAARPHHHTAHAGRSEALRLLGRYDDALDAIDAAISFRPQWPHYHWERGRLLELIDRLPEAADAYRHAIEALGATPDAMAYRNDLARVLIATNQLEQASSTLRVLVAYDPENANSVLSLASVEDALDNDVVAETLYQQAYDLTDHPQARLSILMRLIRLYTTSEDPNVHDLETAMVLAQHMVTQTQQQDPNALLVLASVHAAAERYDLAIAAAEQSLNLASAMQLDELAAHSQSLLDSYREEVSARDAD